MYKILLTLIALPCMNAVTAQEAVKKYVMENTIQVKSIEPDSTDYTDLEAIGKAIADAKIVMLGEQDHGDAPTFLAKTRLIKYLHEKMGFNVLAFESDFFGVNYGWDLVQKGQRISDSIIKNNIYPLWTYCKTGQSLFYQYIPATLKTSNPLQLAGFDSQVYMTQVLPVLDSVLRKLNIPLTQSAAYTEQVLPLLKPPYKNIKDTAANSRVMGYLTTIRWQLQEILPPSDFWLMVMDNIIQWNRQLRQSGKDYWEDMNGRDRQMATNLYWLCKVKYPHEKIIVWAHNYHIAKYAGHYPEDFLNAAKPMGSVFTEDASYLSKTYVIGFTSYQGTAGRLNGDIYKVDKPEKNSFENWINPSLNYAFVDFKKFNSTSGNTSDDFNMSGAVKGRWYHKNHKAQWNRIFDGVFYIKDMYPCKEN